MTQIELQPEWDILRWAAGAEVDLPQAKEVNERRLMELVVTHRLGPRFLHRLKTENVRPSWLSDWMLQHLRGQNAKTTAQIELRIRALREICEALPDARPIVIKGFSAYAATGEPRFIRPSGDLDILVPDLEKIFVCLTKLGYGIVHHDERSHECATAARTSVSLEIHRYFPVYAFPPEVETSDLAPQNHPGVWRQNFAAPSRCELRYQDLKENAVCGQTPSTTSLHFPDLSTTAFILCAHEFRELIQSPFELPIPIRLALLADIYELAQHNDFDNAHFCDLVKRFGGTASVRVVGHFLHTVFGRNPLPIAHSEYSTNTPLVRQIGFRGGWVSCVTAHECLLGLENISFLQRLGTNQVALGANGETAYLDVREDGTGNVERAIIHIMEGAPLKVRVAIRRSENKLLFEIILPVLHEPQMSYRVRFDGVNGNINCAVNIDPCGILQQKGDWRVNVSDEVYAVFITLLVENEPQNLLLTISKRNIAKADFYNAECVTVLPVCFVKR